MYAAAVVADDLTGSIDTAHAFAARGHRTAVLALPGERPTDADLDASVVGVNAASRDASRRDAAAAVGEAVSATPADVVYKKVDSTLRGNVGAETDAALSAAGDDLAVVAPAFPAGGRTTEGGVHHVEGTPVAETEYGSDEAGPASSAVADQFAATDRPLATVERATVREGRDAVVSAFRAAVEGSDRAPVVVCDASTDADLATVAAAAEAFDALYVGSAGLAEHVAVRGVAGDAPARSVRPTGAALGVVGSTNSTTLGQLARLPGEAVFELDPVAAPTAGGNEGPTARAAERLRTGVPAVITAATDRAAVDRTRAAGADRGLAPGEVRERVAAALGEAAASVVREAAPSGLFLTGGDVAAAVVRALDATTVRLTGEAVDAGVPVGLFADGAAAGTPVVTKAGGFGGEGTIVNCLNALSPDDE